jgi:cytochrome c oxidase cbb3-type subunit 4
VSIAEFQAYGYVAAMVVLVFVTYGYAYHLYTKKKDASGKDYEEYSNMALRDDLTDTSVSARSEHKEK